MLTAVVTFTGSNIDVALSGASLVTADEATEAAGPENDLNPIFPEVKEVVWGFGAFVVLALAMRLFLFRKVKDGITSRYDLIEGDFAQAEALTAAARSEVAEYEAQVAGLRSEAQARVEAARATLEAERTEQISAVNARIATKRGAALAEVDAAKAASRGEVESAVAEVSARLSELAAGRRPSDEAVRRGVAQAMGHEVTA